MENSEDENKCSLGTMDPEAMLSNLKPNNSLEDELVTAGLDFPYWSSVLKDKFGVTDKKQLNYLDEQDYQLLTSHIRYRWEEKGFQKLFGISVPSTSEGLAKTEGKSTPSINQKNVFASSTACKDNLTKNLAIKELNEKRSETRLEESKTCLTNERPRKDYVEGLIKDFSADNESKCLPSESISDEEILKTASGGLALQGIFKTDRVEDLLKDRQQLIKVDTCKLSGPRQNSHYKKYEFSCYRSHNEFFESLKKLGCSYGIEHNLGFPAMQAKHGLQNTSISSTNVSVDYQSEQAYIAATVCHYIPLASAFIDQFTLSDSAKKELIQINKLLHNVNEEEYNPNLLEHAERFFQTFGSHVLQGPIHFGGTFWWKAYAEKFSEQNYDMVKTKVSSVLERNCSAQTAMSQPVVGSHHLNISNRKGTYPKTFRDDLNTVVQLSIDKFGGPSETDDHTLWKNNLSRSNNTWAVIDRGSTLTPVWEIISAQHNDQFKDPSRLCNFLKRAYEKITHQHVDAPEAVTILNIVREAKEKMDSVHKWCVSDAENHLRDLLKLKMQITECTTSFTQWVDVCLSNKALQKFLTDITQYDDDNLRFMTYLLMETHCHEVKIFPNRAQILKWVKGDSKVTKKVNDLFITINKFSDVQTVLENAAENFQHISGKDQNDIKTITRKVTDAINAWINTMKEAGHNDLVLLVQSVAKVVGYREDTFNPILGSQEVDFLKKELSDMHRKYMNFREESLLKAQAFCLLTMLTSATNKGHVLPMEKQKLLDYFTQAMTKDIIPDLRQAIAEFSQHATWELFEEKLRSIIVETIKLKNSSMSTDKQSISENKQVTETLKMQDDIKTTYASEFFQLPSPYKKLFEKLDLLKHYPAKISNADINNINTKLMCSNEVATEKELWLHFIYRLLTLDVNVRFLCLEPELRVSCITQHHTVESFISFGNEKGDSGIKQEANIHPMDILMAVFHCSNDFVRQFVFTQLLKCHFAVPLLVPNLCSQQIELPLWPLQMSALTLQATEKSAVTGSILDVSLPVVTFLRLGTSKNSKSKIINDIINKGEHPTFFSHHCKGSTKTRLLLDGVAEISWYLSEGKSSDIFKSCVAFINLHGDACNYPKQVQFLKGLSSVILLLLPENFSASVTAEIKHFLDCKTPVIGLFSGQETTDKKDLMKIAAKNRREAELSEEIIYKCNQHLSHENRKQKLNDHLGQAKDQGFIIGSEVEIKGRNEAERLLKIFYDEERNNRIISENQQQMDLEDTHLPLQGNLWKQWCIKDRQFHRLQCKKQISIEQQRADISVEKQNIRKKQQKKASTNTFMKHFLQYVVHVEEKEGLYFLNWFRKCLDDAVTGNLTDLRKQYTVWLKNREISDEEKKEHLCKLSKQIKHATIGIQHLFQEISQLYESYKSLKLSKTINDIAVDQLPEIAVDFMLAGHPLELMGGDVNYVPIDWVSAVLNKLIDKLGDKKVLVLSVVGLQSSGKSTLLNTMFGLNFAVSSGRCTRGAFMHLLLVEEEMRNQLSFDYIFVVDTEGLRSTETDPDIVVKNDNELATLIIGISDVTLINVMGENVCEVQNILQVCFQAFLRMKTVNIKPSCVFVHQNVSDITARENNQGGRVQLIEKLDEISRVAAEEENQVVLGFSEIIKFDVNSDVFYFKNLFKGDPPMAPLNPSYSENVQELKKRVLLNSDWQSLLLSELSQRLKDIWHALLNENFVFNFLNSLHMKVYNNLEAAYQRWSWNLRKTALETQKTLNCRIKSGELSSTKELELKCIFEDSYKDIRLDVKKYFTEHNHSDILSQWSVLIDRRLEILKKELSEETYEKALKELIRRKLHVNLDKKIRQYEIDLFEKSIVAASALRNQTPSQDLIQTEFDKHWTQWTTDLSLNKPKETETDIDKMVENALFSRFNKHKNVICRIPEDFKFESDKHVKKTWPHNPQINVHGNEISKQILEDINKRITEKAAYENEVTENSIHEILEEIDEMIQKYEQNIKFTSLYKASISAYVCNKATRNLKKINEDFKSANDPLTHLMNQKQTFFQLYQRYCQGAELGKTFVSVLTDNLKEAMKYALYDKLCLYIVEHLKDHHAAFQNTKTNLEHHIMKHLAEKGYFEEYIMYIESPKSYCKEFIRECVLKYIDEKQNEILKEIRSSWSQMSEEALSESLSASEKTREKRGNASMWLDWFCSGLQTHHIPLSRERLRTIEDVHLDNLQIIQELVTLSLQELLNKTQQDPRSLLGSGPLSFKLKEKPVDALFEQMQGCWEQCPFCQAVCNDTIPNHNTEHFVKWHRCQAIGRLFHQRRFKLKDAFTLNKGNNDEKHFVLDFCSTSVISDNEFRGVLSGKETWIPFKDYKKAGPPYSNWKITADNQDRLYWKWFVCTFKKQLEKEYQFKFEGLGRIPEAWENITKDDVLNEMNSIINDEMKRNK